MPRYTGRVMDPACAITVCTISSGVIFQPPSTTWRGLAPMLDLRSQKKCWARLSQDRHGGRSMFEPPVEFRLVVEPQRLPVIAGGNFI